MGKREKLLELLRHEIDTEEASGFARLSRVPESRVFDKLKHYKTLSRPEQEAFKDCAAHSSYNQYAFLVEADELDPKQHPYYYAWLRTPSTLLSADDIRDVPLLRAMVQQYKIDKHRGVPSHVTEKQFAYAASIQAIKAPELRRPVRATLGPFGLSKVDDLGTYHCHLGKRDFCVNIDFGGRDAQLRYLVSLPEFTSIRPYTAFGFEMTLGFGVGHWNFIIEENVNHVFALFAEVVQYSIELPLRVKDLVH
jgi:hypothetical protein